jgi:hypothetical protein
MATFVAQLAMPARKLSAATSNSKGEGSNSSAKLEDFAVFLPRFYKRISKQPPKKIK